MRKGTAVAELQPIGPWSRWFAAAVSPSGQLCEPRDGAVPPRSTVSEAVRVSIPDASGASRPDLALWCADPIVVVLCHQPGLLVFSSAVCRTQDPRYVFWLSFGDAAIERFVGNGYINLDFWVDVYGEKPLHMHAPRLRPGWDAPKIDEWSSRTFVEYRPSHDNDYVFRRTVGAPVPAGMLPCSPLWDPVRIEV